MTCVDDRGDHWPLSDCLDSIPSASMGSLDGVGSYIGSESIECFEVSGCGGQFIWTTTPWSECRLNTAYMDAHPLCHSALRRLINGETENVPGNSDFTGFQTRNAKCYLRSGSTEADQREAPEQYCERAHVPKPIERQSCTAEFTCYRWTNVHFSQVRSTVLLV